MGTGSAGGGGGGGSGFGGGPGLARLGSYTFRRGNATERTLSQAAIRREISGLVARRATTEYLRKQFTSPLLASVYEHLMDLAVGRNDEDPLERLRGNLQVDPGPGFLLRLADTITSRNAELEPDRRVRETVRVCLEDFLIQAIGNDPDVYTSATHYEVLQRLDRSVLDRTLGYFLGSLISRVVERETERLPIEASIRLQAEAQRRADQAIASFERRFVARQQARHRDFFAMVRKEPAWFLKEIAS